MYSVASYAAFHVKFQYNSKDIVITNLILQQLMLGILRKFTILLAHHTILKLQV